MVRKRMVYNTNILNNINWVTTGSVTTSPTNINFTGAGSVTGTPDINLMCDEFKIDLRVANPSNYTDRYNPTSFIHIQYQYMGGNTFKGSYPIIGGIVTVKPDVSEMGEMDNDFDQYPIKNFRITIESKQPMNISIYRLYKSTRDAIVEKDGGITQNEDGSYNIGDNVSGGGGGTSMSYVRGVPVVLTKFSANDYYPPDNTVDAYVDGYVQEFKHFRRPNFSSPPTPDVPEGEFTDNDHAYPWWATDTLYDNIVSQIPETIKYLYANDGRVYISWGDSNLFYATSDYSDPFQVVHGYSTYTARWVLALDYYFAGTADGEFQYNADLEYIEVPHVIKGVDVTSYKNMFGTVNILGVRSSNQNVTDMSYMFERSAGRSIDLTNFYTGSVVNMSDMFRYSAASIINMSGFNTSNVENMSSMFLRAKANSLNLSNFDTSKVTNMGAMFSTSEATSIDISSFDTSNVTNMYNMFNSSAALILDLSNFNTSNVTNMGRMFTKSKATTLDVSSFDTSKVTNMEWMFVDSPAPIIDVSNFNTSNVTNMDGMFGRTEAEVLDVSNFNTSSVTNMEGMFAWSQVKRLDLSSFDTYNVTTMEEMFRGSQAEEIIFGDQFITANTYNMEFMFAGSKAKVLDLSGFSFTHKVDNSRIRLGLMFSGAEVETIYVRSQADADRIQAGAPLSTGLPAHTNVIVK